MVSLQQRGAADRKQFLGQQPDGVQARPLASAIADRRIDIVVLKIHQVGRGGDAHVDAWVRLLEGGQPRQQPLCGE